MVQKHQDWKKKNFLLVIIIVMVNDRLDKERQYLMFQRRAVFVVNNRFLRGRFSANDLIGFFNGLIGATCRPEASL